MNESMSITINKVRLKHATADIEYDEVVTAEEDVHVNTCTIKGGHTRHSDLTAAMQTLLIHALLISEQITLAKQREKSVTYTDPAGNMWPIKPEQEHLMHACEITGMTIGGSDENEGVVISLTRRLSTGMVLNLNTPFTKIAAEEPVYEHTGDLNEAIYMVKEEAKQYLYGKAAPNPQLEIFSQEQGTGTEES